MSIIEPTTALVCLIALGLLVAVLNLIPLLVISKSSSRRYSNQCSLFWLLSANVLIGLLSLPAYGLKKYRLTSKEASGTICDIWRYSYFTFMHLAMSSLIMVTLERIICLTYPFRYRLLLTKRRVNSAMVFLWCFFSVFDMIPFFPVHKFDDEFCHYVVKKHWAVAMNIVTMAIPLPCIIGIYSYMTVLAYKQALRIRDNSTIKEKVASRVDNLKLAVEIKATRKVISLVGSYIICWLPSTSYYLLEWICPQCYPNNYQPHKTWIRFFFKLLVLFHALVTPVLFCWQSEHFRGEASSYFSKKFHGSSQKAEKCFSVHVRSRISP